VIKNGLHIYTSVYADAAEGLCARRRRGEEIRGGNSCWNGIGGV
jgi:hypothetical protein